MINERLKQLKILSTKINERHGSSTIGVGAAMKPMSIPRLRTGSLQLDFALGGGIPIGRATMFYGEKSSGKTSTMYRIMGMAQNVCANCFRPVHNIEVVEVEDDDTGEVSHEAKGTCDCFKVGAWVPKKFAEEKDSDFKERKKVAEENSYEEFRVALVDAEGSYDPEWAGRLGMDNKRLLYVCPDTAEEAIDIYEAILRTGSVDILGLDSIAALTPSKEVEESVTGDTWILAMSPDGDVFNIQIRDLHDMVSEECSGWKTRVMDMNSNKFRWGELKKVWRLPAGKKIYEVKTAYGRTVRLTEDHSIYVVKEENRRKDKDRMLYVSDGKLEKIRGGELRFGLSTFFHQPWKTSPRDGNTSC